MTQAPSIKEALEQAISQIEYLHEKFSETGSGNAVLAKLRAALATFQPDGERREAIARELRSFHRNSCYPEAMDGEVSASVDRIVIASGLVQNEAGIREKIAKEADKKAADLLDAAERLRAYIGATKLAYTEADLHEQAGTAISGLAAAIRSARDGGAET